MQTEKLQLQAGEQILGKAKISKASILILWISVPCFLLIGFGGLYFPIIVQALSVGGFLFLVDAELAGGISAVALGVLTAIIIILASIWCVVAAVMTKRNTCYSLIFTNLRVVATTKTQHLEAPSCELKNVFVGNSLIGNILHYGTLTVQTERGSITVKNVRNPALLKQQLFDLMEKTQKY